MDFLASQNTDCTIPRSEVSVYTHKKGVLGHRPRSLWLGVQRRWVTTRYCFKNENTLWPFYWTQKCRSRDGCLTGKAFRSCPLLRFSEWVV